MSEPTDRQDAPERADEERPDVPERQDAPERGDMPERPADEERPDVPGRAELARVLASVGRGPDARSTNIPSGGGTPDWLASLVRHCTRCGTELASGMVDGEDRERLWCPACGFVSYVNPRLVVTTLPVTPTGGVVLLRRGIEPGLGSWAQPGGFLEVDETVTEAAVRETWEETGLVVEPRDIVGLYSRLEAAIVVIAFEAVIIGGTPHATPEALEVRAFGPEDIPWEGIAFTTTTWALRDWVRSRQAR